MPGNYSYFLSSADFFQNYFFSKNSFGNIIRLSNSLDPDQDRSSVKLDLGSNCLQRPEADDKIHRWQAELKYQQI